MAKPSVPKPGVVQARGLDGSRPLARPRSAAADRLAGRPAAARLSVAHLVLLAGAARALVVAADVREGVVGVADGVAAELHFALLGRARVGEVLRRLGSIKALRAEQRRMHLGLGLRRLGATDRTQDRGVRVALVPGLDLHPLGDLDLLRLCLLLELHLEVEQEADGLLADALLHGVEHVEALAL